MAEYAILTLAVWRISYFIVEENGPLMFMARIRAHLASRQKRSGGLFDLISCIKCVSVWAGLTASLFVSNGVFLVIANGLAFSAGAILLDVVFRKLYALKLVTSPARND